MSFFALLMVAFSESCALVGQFCFKIAMDSEWASTRARSAASLAAGMAIMAAGFFVWLALLSKFDLSFIYPFEGLNRIFLLIAAAVFLKERVTLRLWIGVLLISAGVGLVAMS